MRKVHIIYARSSKTFGGSGRAPRRKSQLSSQKHDKYVRGGPGCEPAAPDLSIIYGFDFVGKTRGEAARAPNCLRREGLGASSGAAAWPCLPQRARVLTEELGGRMEPVMGQPKLSLPGIRLSPFPLQHPWPLLEKKLRGLSTWQQGSASCWHCHKQRRDLPSLPGALPEVFCAPLQSCGCKSFPFTRTGFIYVCDCSLDS